MVQKILFLAPPNKNHTQNSNFYFSIEKKKSYALFFTWICEVCTLYNGIKWILLSIFVHCLKCEMQFCAIFASIAWNRFSIPIESVKQDKNYHKFCMERAQSVWKSKQLKNIILNWLTCFVNIETSVSHASHCHHGSEKGWVNTINVRTTENTRIMTNSVKKNFIIFSCWIHL